MTTTDLSLGAAMRGPTMAIEIGTDGTSRATGGMPFSTRIRRAGGIARGTEASGTESEMGGMGEMGEMGTGTGKEKEKEKEKETETGIEIGNTTGPVIMGGEMITETEGGRTGGRITIVPGMRREGVVVLAAAD
jgi:hypothetical protein